MKSPTEESPVISRGAILEHLAKVLSSQSFQGAERSAKLLRFLVEQTVNGQPDRLKEYTLGTEALGRGVSFDPRTDTIVRAEVSRLRNRLDRYYVSEGLADTLAIALSKGSYVPRFQNRRGLPDGTAIEEKKPPQSKNITRVAVGLGLAACVFVAAMWGIWRISQPPDAVSIAVLPFANVSAETSQEFFSDGMTDEIAEALSAVPTLRIVARSSAYAFKNQNKQARAIGQALGASHLIEGSVRQVGNHVRITAQLIEAENGLQLWSASYDRDITDVFAIQEDIATAIAGALRVPLGLQRGDTLVRNQTKNLDSYQHYLQAKALMRARGLKPLSETAALLEQVVASDPGFAPAWALLALTYTVTPTFDPASASGSVDEYRRVVDASLPRAEVAARRAIQLDPKLAVGYVSLGLTQQLRGKLLQAEELYFKALALDPNDPDALHYYSELLADAGRLTEALAMKLQVRALEPFFPIVNYSTALMLFLNGQDDAALAALKSVPADFVFLPSTLAAIYASMGRYNDAANVLMETSFTVATPDAVEEAVRLLRTAPAPVASSQTLPYLGSLEFVYLYVGAPDRAVGFDSVGMETGYMHLGSHSVWHSSYAPVRKTERFKAYLRTAGRVDYWRAKGWPKFCHPTTGDDFTCV